MTGWKIKAFYVFMGLWAVGTLAGMWAKSRPAYQAQQAALAERARQEAEAKAKADADKAADQEARRKREETEKIIAGISAKRQMEAANACLDRVRQSAKFQSKANFVSGPFTTDNGTEFVVRGRVELMNGFGAMIPHRYDCTWTPYGIIKGFSLVEG